MEKLGLLLLLPLLLMSCSSGTNRSAGYDPVTMDPPVLDEEYPAGMVPVLIPSHGSNMNGMVYTAQGKGPNPTVVLLHGFPGNEKNLDLAQALRRAGWNVLFFHYRGAWGSQGAFSLDHAVEDVSSALTFLRSEENLYRFRVDAGRIVLIGHSMGGFMALRTVVDDPDIRGVVSIAGGNISEFGRWAMESKENEALYEVYVTESSPPLNGIDILYLIKDVMENQEKWDLRTHAESLSQKILLLIGALRDEEVPMEGHYTPFVDALEKYQPQRLSQVILDTDHSFTTQRIKLAREIVAWLEANVSD